MHHQRWGGFNKKATCEGLGSSRKSRSLEGEGEQKCCGEYPNRIWSVKFRKILGVLKKLFHETNEGLFTRLMGKTDREGVVVLEKRSI